MGVHDGSQRTHMPCESLGEEKIMGCSVHVGHRSVAQGMQGIEATKPCLDLPASERMLHPALGDALPALVAEER